MESARKHCLVKLGRTGKCYTLCTVVETKKNYGRTYYKVQPVVGKGTVWVEKVKLLK